MILGVSRVKIVLSVLSPHARKRFGDVGAVSWLYKVSNRVISLQCYVASPSHARVHIATQHDKKFVEL